MAGLPYPDTEMDLVDTWRAIVSLESFGALDHSKRLFKPCANLCMRRMGSLRPGMGSPRPEKDIPMPGFRPVTSLIKD